MSGGEYDFDQAARAGDPAAYVAGLTDSELRALAGYNAALLKQSDSRRGFPMLLEYRIVMEKADRFDKLTDPKPS